MNLLDIELGTALARPAGPRQASFHQAEHHHGLEAVLHWQVWLNQPMLGPGAGANHNHQHWCTESAAPGGNFAKGRGTNIHRQWQWQQRATRERLWCEALYMRNVWGRGRCSSPYKCVNNLVCSWRRGGGLFQLSLPPSLLLWSDLASERSGQTQGGGLQSRCQANLLSCIDLRPSPRWMSAAGRPQTIFPAKMDAFIAI